MTTQADRGVDEVDVGGCTWVSLKDPTPAAMAAVAQRFALPHLAVEDAVNAHQRPKLERYDEQVFAIVKPVRYVDHEEVVDVSEVALFLGREFVVSVQHGETSVLDRVRAELTAPEAKVAERGPGGVLYRVVDLVVDGYEDAIDAINDDVDEIETQVFSDEEAGGHSQRIYKLKREIAEFRRAVQPLATPLGRLADGDVPGVGQEAAVYFRDVHDHVLRAADAIEGHDRLLSDVLQADLARASVRQAEIATKQSEVAVRQNEDMRKISAWAAIALVPTAIAGIYGMNFDHMPELRWRYGYPLVVAVIAAVCLGLHRLFRRNGWL